MKTQYRITNWAKYNRSLINRGNIFLYFTAVAIRQWHHGGGGDCGRPREYSSSAIETFLTLRTLLHLPLRQTQGIVEGLIEQLNLEITCPNYTLACRRAKELEIKIRRLLNSENAIHVLVDSSGLKIYGEGEWKMRTHGKSKRRTWRKIHIAVDRDKKTIVACEITEATVGDTSAVKDLVEQTSTMESFTADGAYDASDVRTLVKANGAIPIIPPDENAIISKANHPERNEAVKFIQDHGDNEEARKLWKQNSGYYQRNGVENTFFRYKTIFGEKLKSRVLANQKTEGMLRCHLLNKMTKMGMPISVPIWSDA